jgi:hypothetical protein
MLNRRKVIEKDNFEWQDEGVACWLLNENIIPSSRIFLPCKIKEKSIRPNSEFIKVFLDDQRYLMELKVKKRYLFQRSMTANLPESKISELADYYQSEMSLFQSNVVDLLQEDEFKTLSKALNHSQRRTPRENQQRNERLYSIRNISNAQCKELDV